ncbi:hypothetical protein ACA758_00195 [Mycoplasmopsis agassizii]|uniref:hypothetical protein n=1 Tax=Mycoplasmopsis agassizii TaxID=33922 RepID=UPI003529ADA1
MKDSEVKEIKEILKAMFEEQKVYHDMVQETTKEILMTLAYLVNVVRKSGYTGDSFNKEDIIFHWNRVQKRWQDAINKKDIIVVERNKK